MPYANFKPTVWAPEILAEKEKYLCFKQDCDFKYQGKIKKGERVKILGTARPTIKDYIPNKPIDGPETPADASVYIDIDQFKYFNIGVEDIDKAQKVGELSELVKEASRGMAELEDKYCAERIAKDSGTKLKDIIITSSAEARDLIDEMFVQIWKNDVSLKDNVTLYIHPELYNFFHKFLIDEKTDNTNTINTGIVGRYRNAGVKMTNCLYTKDEHTKIILKNSRAFGFVDGIDELKPFEPESGFGEAIKCLNTWGGKVVRPKEIVTASVKIG